MKLRKLVLKDAPLMFEWMHSKDVTKYMFTDFNSKTIEDCTSFIKQSNNQSNDLHLAIVSDKDEYQGTVSLKHIDKENKNAEFAIIVRECAMSKGYSWYGMVKILDIAFDELGLENVYWCVNSFNERACRFYDKHGFHQIVDIPDTIFKRYDDICDYRWYSVLTGDDYHNALLSKGEIAGCKIININTISTINAGELSFFEANKEIDFDIKRVYYISKVPEGTRRGFHAHKKLKQVLFCPYGEIQLVLDNGKTREEMSLNDPSIGIVIDKPIWREMLWLKKNSVLCVAASEYYDDKDYIRDYKEYIEISK